MTTADTMQATKVAFLTEAELRAAVVMLDQGERSEAWRIGAEAFNAAFQQPNLMAAIEATAYQSARILRVAAGVGAPERHLLAIVELLTLRANQIQHELEAQAQTGHCEIGHA
jgi:hypothetical protein